MVPPVNVPNQGLIRFESASIREDGQELKLVSAGNGTLELALTVALRSDDSHQVVVSSSPINSTSWQKANYGLLWSLQP